uniref:Uncharacterized protein n=1 Tax=Oryza punctata TaxID=4537 RepID=A0A0E0LUI7_ORYPU
MNVFRNMFFFVGDSKF